MISKQDIERLVEEKISGSKFFLVEVKVSPAKIAVFIDHPEGVKLEDCVELSQYLQSVLDEAMQTHELEVSSPGIDEPFKVRKQFEKHYGDEVTVLLKNGIRKEGMLKISDEESLTMEENRKGLLRIPFNEIKETRPVFSFKKK